MRVLTKQFITKWVTLFASSALLIAASSVQTTCLIMSCQLDMPDELKYD